ncbi:MAG TPA: dihydroorotase [Kiritimatiellia bacterium]|nr:dihydroorotase [Kiritimatiellia bacterium]HRZ11036.1 dihydroorotase [Kiritimatiellia bacterium]HSA18609.1 dihydroorotase [Kiritimatiellia bacterium]
MTGPRAILIRGARLLDPVRNLDAPGDLFLAGGLIAAPPLRIPPDAEIIEARGLAVAPGFIDLHVHLREPGGEEAETIETGCRAAARGGFTTVVAMPNTRPPLDTPELVSAQIRRAEEAGLCRVRPAACITSGRTGGALAPLAELAAAGACAFTDDGTTVADEALMRRALEQAAALGRPILDHAQDPAREKQGVMHEGAWSARWGLPGIPSSAEIEVVERDIRLARETGGRVHIQHVSAAGSAALIRRARAAGLPVSGEATPHHLALTDADVRPEDARWKMNPPLRSEADRAAVLGAVEEGTITVLATDHAPHTAAAKARGFRDAPFGVIGLEAAVGVTYTRLVAGGRMSALDWVRRWTSGPARVLGLPEPSLAPGLPADVALLDLDTEWEIRPESFASKSRNTPFEGWRVRGRAVRTFLGGRTTARA